MRETLPEFERRGVRVAAVVQGTAEEAARFCGRHGVERICVPDPDKASYRAIGLPRTSWGALVFALPALRRRRAEARAAGCANSLTGTLRKHSDVLQLPGAAVIGRDGRILWVHRGAHPGDLPSAAALLETVDRLLPATRKEETIR
ncbi:MAG: AhpC/TSA family protein [Candidatus Rokuibacteriota bacterium]